MYFIDKEEKIKKLVAEVSRREHEVFEYQLNIDNFERALAKIGVPKSEHMEEFSEHLCGLIEQNRGQQEISQLMLDVVLDQLVGVDISAFVGKAELE